MTSFKNSICERCLKHCSEHSAIHTCTPTKGWAALEAEVERLKAELATVTADLKAEVICSNNMLKELDALRSASEPVKFLADATRYKVARLQDGCAIYGLPDELAGEWVALVEATDNCHLKMTQPAQSKDAERYAWLRSQHNEHTPIAAVVWKKGSIPASTLWCNLINGNDLDKHIDEAMKGK